jgi:exodeoxyribonuclease-5
LKTATRIREAIDNGRKVAIDAPHAGNIYQAVPQYLAAYQAQGPDHCISIARSHKQNHFFNDLVRKRMFGNNVKPIEAGDLMLITQSWARNGHSLYNGDHVTVEEVCLDKIEQVAGLHFAPVKLRYRKLDGKENVIEDYLALDCLFNENGALMPEQEKAIRFERNKKNVRYRESGNPEDDRYVGSIHLTYGHSITCNKAQGGEWDKVFVNAMGTGHDMKWSYTAVTRAKTSLVQY